MLSDSIADFGSQLSDGGNFDELLQEFKSSVEHYKENEDIYEYGVVLENILELIEKLELKGIIEFDKSEFLEDISRIGVQLDLGMI